MKTPISVTILTKNSQKYLKEVLNSLTSFDEVLICDTGSTDDTLIIASKFSNVTIHKQFFSGFGPTHNIASNLARNEWILSIDSDEVLSKELEKEITQTALSSGCIYSFPRHNEYKGKWIKWCGWYPDRQVRLYNRQETQFTDAQVHEAIITKNLREVKLQNPLRHYSYNTVSDFLLKMESYSTLFAKQYKGKKDSSMFKAISHGLFAFFKSYILKKGIFGGSEGFEISVYNGNTAFYKYLKLAEANRQKCLEPVEKCGDDRKKTLASSTTSTTSTPYSQPTISSDK